MAERPTVAEMRELRQETDRKDRRAAVDVRLLRPALRRCLPCFIALAVATLLVDLFFFRYHRIGPTLFGILCLLAGSAVGRAQPMSALEGCWGVAQRVFILFWISSFLGVGLLCLLPPLFRDLPDNVTNSSHWEVSTPDGRHARDLGRGRLAQLFIGPVFLWGFGVISAMVLCSFFVRPRPQENGGVGGAVSSPEAGGRATAGARPWAYTAGLYLILMVVTIRMVLSQGDDSVVLADRAGPEGNEPQRWELRDAGKGAVVIVNPRSGKALDYNSLTKEVIPDHFVAGSWYQRWVLVDIGGGKILIRNEPTRLVLEPYNEGPKAGHVYLEGQQGDKGGEAQAWMLQRVEGRVVIIHVQTGKVLDFK